jgi:hypothetical protein
MSPASPDTQPKNLAATPGIHTKTKRGQPRRTPPKAHCVPLVMTAAICVISKTFHNIIQKNTILSNLTNTNHTHPPPNNPAEKQPTTTLTPRRHGAGGMSLSPLTGNPKGDTKERPALPQCSYHNVRRSHVASKQAHYKSNHV